MPKKVRPRYGWQQPSFRLGVPDHDVKSRYLGVFFEEIAEEFDVPDELLTKLESTVLHAGAIYKQLKLLRQEAPQPKERLAALVDLKEALSENYGSGKTSMIVAGETYLLASAIYKRSVASAVMGELCETLAQCGMSRMVK